MTRFQGSDLLLKSGCEIRAPVVTELSYWDIDLLQGASVGGWDGWISTASRRDG